MKNNKTSQLDNSDRSSVNGHSHNDLEIKAEKHCRSFSLITTNDQPKCVKNRSLSSPSNLITHQSRNAFPKVLRVSTKSLENAQKFKAASVADIEDENEDTSKQRSYSPNEKSWIDDSSDSVISNPMFKDPIGSYGKSSGARFIRDKLRSKSAFGTELTLEDTTTTGYTECRKPKTPLGQFGENLSGMFSTVASTFSRKQQESIDIGERFELDSLDGKVLSETKCNEIKSLQISPITPINDQMTDTTPLTNNTTAPLSTKSNWFDFTSRDTSWYSFKFSTAKEPRST